MREAPSEFDLCWRELATVAKALADGRDMSEIGLMRDIAQRTVAVLADDARIYRPAAMSDALRKAPRRLTKRFGWCLGRNAPTSACLWIDPGRRLAHNGLVGGSNPPGPTTQSGVC